MYWFMLDIRFPCILYAEAMYCIRVPDTLSAAWFKQGCQEFVTTLIQLLMGTEGTHSNFHFILVSTNLDACRYGCDESVFQLS